MEEGGKDRHRCRKARSRGQEATGCLADDLSFPQYLSDALQIDAINKGNKCANVLAVAANNKWLAFIEHLLCAKCPVCII